MLTSLPTSQVLRGPSAGAHLNPSPSPSFPGPVTLIREGCPWQSLASEFHR